jgi:hypothetical protein
MNGAGSEAKGFVSGGLMKRVFEQFELRDRRGNAPTSGSGIAVFRFG